jgi:hypothetical protein
VATEEEMTHRQTAKRWTKASCLAETELGGPHAAHNQVILIRPARAATDGDKNTP